MLHLEIEVTGKPVVEEAGINVTGGDGLGGEPVVTMVPVYLHGDVVHLSDKCEPEALKEPEIDGYGFHMIKKNATTPLYLNAGITTFMKTDNRYMAETSP